MTMREEAELIMAHAISDVQPDQAVKRALKELELPAGRVLAVAVGKAAWQMARSAAQVLGDRLSQGIVITKYGHSCGAIDGFQIFEAGHPVPDDNSFLATSRAVEMIRDLTPADLVIMLISGGGSALLELPLCSREQLRDVTSQLLACGADIREMNMIRKRLSGVKGGRFAALCEPAEVYGIVLSDILGDPLDMIASGPVSPDSSTCEMCRETVEKYHLDFPEEVMELLGEETPKECANVRAKVTGSVRQLCSSAAKTCLELGYDPVILTSSMDCVAREAGSFLAAVAREHQHSERSLAFLAGGETVVRLSGSGLGGRNQELALSAAAGIAGLENTVVFSFGSDGTDGPTDAAGGYVDGGTAGALADQGIRIPQVLEKNDSYHALRCCGGLLVTGPTGTNVNDLSCVLIKRKIP